MTDTIDVAALVEPLVVLSKFNIPPDTLELLVHGNPSRGIPPGALATALKSQADALAEARRENERWKACKDLSEQGWSAISDARMWLNVGQPSDIEEAKLCLDLAQASFADTIVACVARAATAEASLATMREALEEIAHSAETHSHVIVVARAALAKEGK